jgi:hypothetical protein
MTEQKKLSPTEEYIQENKYVQGLSRRVITGSPRVKYTNFSLMLLLKLYRITKNLKLYLIELIKYHEEFLRIIRMKGVKHRCDALVIGNGPSQGYLTKDLISKFKSKGGEVFAVNFWQLNEQLSPVTPDYLVISDPATLSFDSENSDIEEENLSLLAYLKKNNEIKILCPFQRKKELEKLFLKERILCFTDTEMVSLSSNIAPILPRGYISMTLFKALAMALWFGYKNTYIIGMDNTYPRNIFCDKNNKVLNIEKHAGVPDSVVDQSAIYRNIAELLEDLSILFRDIWKFSQCKTVINLDDYSLTDAFTKLNIKVFEEKLYKD